MGKLRSPPRLLPRLPDPPFRGTVPRPWRWFSLLSGPVTAAPAPLLVRRPAAASVARQHGGWLPAQGKFRQRFPEERALFAPRAGGSSCRAPPSVFPCSVHGPPLPPVGRQGTCSGPRGGLPWARPGQHTLPPKSTDRRSGLGPLCRPAVLTEGGLPPRDPSWVSRPRLTLTLLPSVGTQSHPPSWDPRSCVELPRPDAPVTLQTRASVGPHALQPRGVWLRKRARGFPPPPGGPAGVGRNRVLQLLGPPPERPGPNTRRRTCHDRSRALQ